jgi:hypothetical protein
MMKHLVELEIEQQIQMQHSDVHDTHLEAPKSPKKIRILSINPTRTAASSNNNNEPSTPTQGDDAEQKPQLHEHGTFVIDYEVSVTM